MGCWPLVGKEPGTIANWGFLKIKSFEKFAFPQPKSVVEQQTPVQLTRFFQYFHINI